MPIILNSTRKRKLVINWDENDNIVSTTLVVDVLDDTGTVQKQEFLQIDYPRLGEPAAATRKLTAAAIAGSLEAQLKTEKGI